MHQPGGAALPGCLSQSQHRDPKCLHSSPIPLGAEYKKLRRQKQGGNLASRLSPQQQDLGNRLLSLAESSSRKETPDHQPQVMPLVVSLPVFSVCSSPGAQRAMQIILPADHLTHPPKTTASCVLLPTSTCQGTGWDSWGGVLCWVRSWTG